MKVKEQKCFVCENNAELTFEGQCYCNKHWQSMRKWGIPFGHKRTRTSKFIEQGQILEIISKNGEVILADINQKEKLEKYSWNISKTGYAVANISGKTTKMHRYIIGLDNCKDKIVDHKNHNPLDNRIENLRVCSNTENARNKWVSKKCRSGFLGIRKTPSDKYNVRITDNYKEIYIGNFDSLEEAIQARNEAENKYHGEFASHKNPRVVVKLEEMIHG